MRHLEAVRRLAGFGVALALTATICGCAGADSPARASTNSRVNALLGAGRTLLQDGNTNGAKQLFEQAAQKEPRNPAPRYDLGVLYAQEGKGTKALDEYHAALALNSHYVPALYNEAIIMSAKTPFKAMKLYREIVRLQPNAPTALLNLGLLELAAPHEQFLAVVDLRHAYQLDPALASHIPQSVQTQVESPPKVNVPPAKGSVP